MRQTCGSLAVSLLTEDLTHRLQLSLVLNRCIVLFKALDEFCAVLLEQIAKTFEIVLDANHHIIFFLLYAVQLVVKLA